VDNVPADYPSRSDEELARQTQAGSLTAFEEIVYRYERRIYAFVSNSCRSSADAREVTQDTFVKAFQAIDQFDPRFAFASWLFTIARRKCIDLHRAAPPVPEPDAPELAPQPDPAESLARAEDRQALWTLASRLLPEAQFQALWLRYAEDMTVAEIARVLRKTRTHVKVLLFRARQALARKLRAAPQGRAPTPSDDRHRLEHHRMSGGVAPRAAPIAASPPSAAALLGLSLAGRKGLP
jgi:RNA polymerase sigma-70 factor, ECF subfamily